MSLSTDIHVVVETSLPGAALGLFQGGNLIGFERHGDFRGASQFLGEVMSYWISQQHYKPETFVVGSGPGSFTGIKVGIAFVQGLAMAENPPPKVFGVSPMEVLALEHGGAWLIKGTRQQGFLYHEEGFQSLTLSELATHSFSEPLHLLGEWQEFEELRLPFTLHRFDQVFPKVLGGMLQLAKLQQTPLEARYIRRATPEERLEKK